MMSCLHKYWLKEFAKFFFMIQMLILVLFVFIDYLSRVDKFLNSDLTLLGGLGYVLLKLPFMFSQLTPAVILLATLVVFGLMNRNNELLILKSSGISVYFMMKPVLLASLILLGIMFFIGETIIPVTMAKANYIRYRVMTNRENISASREDIWIKSDQKLVHINYFNAAQKTIAGVTVTSMDKDFNLQYRADAKEGIYQEGEWVFQNVLEQVYKKELQDFDISFFERKVIELDIKPDDLEEVAKKTNEMSFSELKDYVKKVQKEGYDATVYQTDMHGKISFLFICIIMAVTGAATGMRSFAKQSMPLAIAVGIVIAFMYWVMFGFCLSLGYGGILPPFFAAWVTNLFFLCFGIMYLINTE